MHVLTAWAEYMTAVGLSPATVKVRTATIHALMRHAGKTDPLDLTRADLLAFLARPRAQWTKLTYWQGARQFSAWAREFGYGTIGLTRGVPRPRTPDPVARPIDDDTIDQLLKARLPRRVRAYVLLALYEALRVHEIAKIRGEDFDLRGRWLTVDGKGGSTKVIPVHPEIVMLAQSMPEFGYWFPSPTRLGHVRAIAVSQSIGNALRSVGCQATAHQLRDTAATRFQRDVKDIRMTQAMIRHKSLQSTMKYTAVSNEALQSALEGISWGQAA